MSNTTNIVVRRMCADWVRASSEEEKERIMIKIINAGASVNDVLMANVAGLDFKTFAVQYSNTKSSLM